MYESKNQTLFGLTLTDEDTNIICQVAKFCIEEEECSTNKIQQEFSLGFNRAISIVNKLEELGVVSKRIDNKRNVLIDLNKLNYLFKSDAQLKEESQEIIVTTLCDEDSNTVYSVAKFCIKEEECSTKKIQQEFNLGFNRTISIVNKLEELGVVSKRTGNKRNVLIDLNKLNDMFRKEE